MPIRSCYLQNNEIRSDRTYTHYYHNFSISETQISDNSETQIPKYSRINNVKFYTSVKKQESTIFSTGNTNLHMFLGLGSSHDSNVKDLYWTNGVITTSYQTFVSDREYITDFFHSEDALAGNRKSNWDNLWINCDHNVYNNWYYINNTRIELDFDFPMITINVRPNIEDGGTVTKSVISYVIDKKYKGHEYEYPVVISAQPKANYRFVKWSDGNTEQSRTIYLSENDLTSFRTEIEYTAIFEKIKYTVTVNCIPEIGGNVIGAGIYESGDTAILTAVSNPNYRFIGWTDGDTDPIRYLLVNSNITVEARFEYYEPFIFEDVGMYLNDSVIISKQNPINIGSTFIIKAKIKSI